MLLRLTRRNLIILIFLSCVGCSKKNNSSGNGQNTNPPPTENSSSRFRIATYNMRVDSKSDLFDWTTVRKQLATDIIKKYKFDILGAQELYYSQLKDVLALTDGVYQNVGVATGNGKPEGTESFDAIFFRKDRFELLQTGDYWYSDTPDVPSLSWNSTVKTHCTWARFKDKLNTKVFYVFNSHLIYNNEVAQLNSANLLAQKVKDIANGFPVFCTGDYNTDVTTPTIKTFLTSSQFIDSKTATTSISDTNKGGTFAGFEKNVNTDWRIDLILINKWIKVVSYGVVKDDFQTTGSASDHLPVYIDALVQ